ncbi:hypothetical protein [Bacillus litorisediminis]|nr:hypothetical protein [Bacillus litorisediminis]
MFHQQRYEGQKQLGRATELSIIEGHERDKRKPEKQPNCPPSNKVSMTIS